MKYLIVGGGGFLGKNLAEHLLANGVSVRIFERADYPRHAFPAHLDVEWRSGDPANPHDMLPALENVDTAFMFASTTVPKTSNDDFVYDIESNLVATISFLDLACRARLRKIVFPSSGGTVYGIPAGIPIDEEHPTNPICSYGINKLAIEKYLALFSRMKGLEYTILRISNPYGKYQMANRGQGVISTFMHKIMHGREIDIWGDGSVVRDYIHVDDVSRAFLRAARVDSEHRVFNIGSGLGLSLNQVLHEMETLLGRKANRRFLEARLLDVPVNVLDIARAERHLGWSPESSFSRGLSATSEWLGRLEPSS